jgi:hypothetical protein
MLVMALQGTNSQWPINTFSNYVCILTTAVENWTDCRNVKRFEITNKDQKEQIVVKFNIDCSSICSKTRLLAERVVWSPGFTAFLHARAHCQMRLCISLLHNNQNQFKHRRQNNFPIKNFSGVSEWYSQENSRQILKKCWPS